MSRRHLYELILAPLLSLPLLLSTLLVGTLGAQDIATLVADLGDAEDYQRRNAAYRSLSRSKPPQALPLLLEALPGYALTSQSLGIALIGSYPLARSNDTFRSLLGADSPYLSLSAAAYLYRRGDHRQLDRMLAALRKGRRPAELSMMLTRINYITAAELQAEVRRLVRTETESTVLRGALYHLLLAKDQKARGVARILLTTAGAPTASRSICAAFLVSMGDAEAATLLNQTLLAPEPGRLANLYQFLIRAGTLSKPILSTILGIVRADQDSSQTILGLRILAAHKHRPALPVIRALLTHSNPTIAKAAYNALASLADVLETSELRELLTSGRTDLVLVAADLLRRMDDLSGLSRVIALLGQGGSHQAEAAKVLGGFRLAASVDPLLDALGDGDLAVRSNALNSLAAVFRSLFPYRRFDLAATGYAAQAPRADRVEGLSRLREFWANHRLR